MGGRHIRPMAPCHAAGMDRTALARAGVMGRRVRVVGRPSGPDCTNLFGSRGSRPFATGTLDESRSWGLRSVPIEPLRRVWLGTAICVPPAGAGRRISPSIGTFADLIGRYRAARTFQDDLDRRD